MTTLDEQLIRYGISNTNDRLFLAESLSDSQTETILAAETRGEIQRVLAELAESQGMNTDNPGRYVHP